MLLDKHGGAEGVDALHMVPAVTVRAVDGRVPHRVVLAGVLAFRGRHAAHTQRQL